MSRPSSFYRYSMINKEVYLEYKKSNPDTKLTLREWRDRVKHMIELINNHVVGNKFGFSLPFRLGHILVLGSKANDSPVSKNKSAHHKKVIYHTNFKTEGYYYKMFFLKRGAKISNNASWNFRSNYYVEDSRYLKKRIEHEVMNQDELYYFLSSNRRDTSYL